MYLCKRRILGTSVHCLHKTSQDDHLSLFSTQAMIRGELEVLKDWCYEAVRPFAHAGSACLNKWTDSSMALLCLDSLQVASFSWSVFVIIYFTGFADVQPASSSNPASQGHGASVPLQDSGHRQYWCKLRKTRLCGLILRLLALLCNLRFKNSNTSSVCSSYVCWREL